MSQITINSYLELDNYLNTNKIDNIFIVCDEFVKKSRIYDYLEKKENITKTYFISFNPNPTYESVCLGVKEFKKSGSNFILAIGGGSALDVSKCIKLFSNLDDNKKYFEQEYVANDVVLMAIPTTAGTGSEATRYAVIYDNCKKMSITHDSIIPSIVMFDANFLETLPLYQKMATCFDAFSHAIESFWSVNSNEESKKYSIDAMEIIIHNMDLYFNGDKSVNEKMLKAANLAGSAINITQTTAGHAMCYKLTSLYGISHGHAAFLINSCLLPFMIDNIDKCCDKRGIEYLKNVFNDLKSYLHLKTIQELKEYFISLVVKYDLYNVNFCKDDIDELVASVNVERLKNNPIKLDSEDIKKIYCDLFKKIEKRKKDGSK